MCRLIAEEQPVARKSYHCDASDWLLNMGLRELAGEWTFAELRAIARARRCAWRIQPGERYVKQVLVVDGEICVFRAIPAIHDICITNDIYDDC